MVKTNKQKIIVANWKMNPASLIEAKDLLLKIKNHSSAKNKIIFCPPFIWLSDLIKISKNITFSGQNCFWEEKGAYTGEISAKMLKNIGCKYVILGHSERKKYFNEDYSIVNKKLKLALKAGLKIILCIGEKEKNEEKKYEEIKSQIKTAFEKISKKDIVKIIIAYEPVWAIGTGDNDTPTNAVSIAILIKRILVKMYGHQIFENIKVLYGGSTNSKNAEEFIKEKEISGLLVGGASLDSNEFLKIIS